MNRDAIVREFIAQRDNEDDLIRGAIVQLDAEGGWDHESALDRRYETFLGLRHAIKRDFVEHGVSFGVPHWRLTDQGIEVRASLDAGAHQQRSAG